MADNRKLHAAFVASQAGSGFAALLALPDKATDDKVVAERKWREGLKAPVAQKACDVGLFSDDANQKELF